MAEGESEPVTIRLVVDDQTRATIDKMASGLKEAQGHADKAKEGIEGAGGATEALGGTAMVAVAAYAAVAAAIYEAFKFTEMLGAAALEAAEAADKQERAMAGVMSLMDGGAHSMGQIRTYAAGLREELEGAGIKAGVSSQQMTDAFNAVIERGNMGTEAARELTEEMAIVGKVTKGGMQGLAEGFSQMEMGMVRARNPLVQLIASTHTLEGNAKKVAAELQKMSPEKQMELAEKAISKQAEIMRAGGAGATPSLASLEESFRGVREAFLTSIGQPMLEKIIPPLVSVKNFLVRHMDEILTFGNKVGSAVGSVIEVIAAIFGGIYDAVKENWGDISAAFHAVGDPLKEAFVFIHEHKDGIAAAFKWVASTIIDAAKTFFDYMGKAADAIIKVAEYIPGLGSKIKESRAETAEGQFRKVAFGQDKPQAFAMAEEQYRKTATAAGVSAEAQARMVEQMHGAVRMAQQMTQAFDQAGATANVTDFGALYRQAAMNHNESMQQYAFNILNNSVDLRMALVSGSLDVGQGFDDFVSMLNEKAPELAAKLKEMTNVVKGEGGIKASGPSVNFNGGQTFNIKQDFRDQDPERIALVFRRDILRASLARTQAKTTSAFGL